MYQPKWQHVIDFETYFWATSHSMTMANGEYNSHTHTFIRFFLLNCQHCRFVLRRTYYIFHLMRWFSGSWQCERTKTKPKKTNQNGNTVNSMFTRSPTPNPATKHMCVAGDFHKHRHSCCCCSLLQIFTHQFVSVWFCFSLFILSL